MSRFGVTTSVEVEVSIINEDNQIVPLPAAGGVIVSGSLIGEKNRVVELTALESSSLGYRFKEWIVEPFPITLVPIAVGGFTQTVQEMCNPESLQTEISNNVWTDDEFFYEDPNGNRVANSGYYGAGSRAYWYHDTATGISGPHPCGQYIPGFGQNTDGGAVGAPTSAPTDPTGAAPERGPEVI